MMHDHHSSTWLTGRPPDERRPSSSLPRCPGRLAGRDGRRSRSRPRSRCGWPATRPRTKPSEGAVHDLWAKALVLEDPARTDGLLVTLDVCGIGRELSNRIRDALAAAARPRTRPRSSWPARTPIAGPVVGTNLLTMYRIDDAERRRIAEYTKWLEDADREGRRRGAGPSRPTPGSPGRPAGPTSRSTAAPTRRPTSPSSASSWPSRGPSTTTSRSSASPGPTAP